MSNYNYCQGTKLVSINLKHKCDQKTKQHMNVDLGYISNIGS